MARNQPTAEAQTSDPVAEAPDFGTTSEEPVTMEENADVDVPAPTDADKGEADEVEKVEGPKKESTSTRPPVPEGYITPVGFAHVLSKKLDKLIPPQQMYSTIKNAPKDHPFPTHEAGGRVNLIIESEGLAWWDEKEKRVAAKKENAAKAAKDKLEKAEKAKAAGVNAGTSETAEATGPVEEAE